MSKPKKTPDFIPVQHGSTAVVLVPERRRISPKGTVGARSLVEWPADLYEDVKRVAKAKGLGTNTWIRQVMERAVRRHDRGQADGE